MSHEINPCVSARPDHPPDPGLCEIPDAGKSEAALERDRSNILEMVVREAPLDEVLGKVAQTVDKQIAEACAAVLLLEDGSVRVLGPALAPEWRRTLRAHGISLAITLSSDAWESPGNCGVSFPQQHEPWLALRPAAAVHSIAACWTVPISSGDGTALGLVSVFCQKPLRPTHTQVEILDDAARLAALCIDHHNMNRELAHRIRHDPLTSLPNRIMLEDAVQSALALAGRSGKHVALMVLDVDNFKRINDSFGHDAGDHFLQLFAYRIGSRLRQTDTLARIGGDEFAVVLPELAGRRHAAAVARKLADAMALPFDLDGHRIQATCSIGIAVTPDNGADAHTLRKKADAALYHVKAHSRNGFSFPQ